MELRVVESEPGPDAAWQAAMTLARTAWDAMTPEERKPLEREAHRRFADLPRRSRDRYTESFCVFRIAERIAAGHGKRWIN